MEQIFKQLRHLTLNRPSAFQGPPGGECLVHLRRRKLEKFGAISTALLPHKVEAGIVGHFDRVVRCSDAFVNRVVVPVRCLSGDRRQCLLRAARSEEERPGGRSGDPSEDHGSAVECSVQIYGLPCFHVAAMPLQPIFAESWPCIELGS